MSVSCSTPEVSILLYLHHIHAEPTLQSLEYDNYALIGGNMEKKERGDD